MNPENVEPYGKMIGEAAAAGGVEPFKKILRMEGAVGVVVVEAVAGAVAIAASPDARKKVGKAIAGVKERATRIPLQLHHKPTKVDEIRAQHQQMSLRDC